MWTWIRGRMIGTLKVIETLGHRLLVIVFGGCFGTTVFSTQAAESCFFFPFALVVLLCGADFLADFPI
jgi:hypothetical protein